MINYNIPKHFKNCMIGPKWGNLDFLLFSYVIFYFFLFSFMCGSWKLAWDNLKDHSRCAAHPLYYNKIPAHQG